MKKSELIEYFENLIDEEENWYWTFVDATDVAVIAKRNMRKYTKHQLQEMYDNKVEK